MNYIKSPIFYMGNKYDLLEQLVSLFPSNIDTLYDLFGGSGVMTLNVKSNKTIYNELNENIYNLLKLFVKYTPEEIENRIKQYIEEFNLNRGGTDIRQNKPNIKNTRKFYNDRYISFRKAYNESERDYLMLYTLTFYSFCNLIRFNTKNEFNMPFGNRCYSEEYKYKIIGACNCLKKKNIEFYNKNAFDILQDTIFNKDDFIYLDPPYSNTTAIYNEKRAFGGWTIEDDYRLFKILEKLDKCGIRWGLSNVFKNKNIKNTHLIKWCEKNNWYVFHLDKNYASLGKGNAESDEVYITNYFSNRIKNQLSLFDI